MTPASQAVHPGTPPVPRPARKAARTSARRRPVLRPQTLVLAVALFLATFGNLALWRALWRLPEISGAGGLAFALAFGLAICALGTALLSLVAWRGLLRPVLALLLLAAAMGSYFMLSYEVVIDRTMLVSALLTDRREIQDLLSPRLLLTLLVLGVAPAVLLWRVELRWPRPLRQLRNNLLLLLASVLVLVAVGLAFYPDLSSTMRNHKEMRYQINPFNTLYAAARLGQQPIPYASAAVQPLGQDARRAALAAGGKPPLLLLVVGETARADHFGINGYARDTTPRLAQLELASLRNAWSCDTYSAGSIPCMFSPLGREAYKRQKVATEGLADVLQRAGYAVLWLDNQPGGCKGVCARVPTVDDTQLQLPGVCGAHDECPDEVMLQGLDARIAQLPAAQRAHGVVVFLHQMGSHGPDYFKRSPPRLKRFEPECRSNALQQCPAAEVVNAYDNTIVTTDDFLSSAIAWLQRHEDGWAPALSYVSDHGESLGERNLYLHGLPYAIAPDEQKHVPWLFWLSPQFQRQSGIALACLQAQRDRPLSHDNYFHTTLGLLGVATSTYDAARDIGAGCAAAPAAR